MDKLKTLLPILIEAGQPTKKDLLLAWPLIAILVEKAFGLIILQRYGFAWFAIFTLLLGVSSLAVVVMQLCAFVSTGKELWRCYKEMRKG